MPLYKKLFRLKSGEIARIFKKALFRYTQNGIGIVVALSPLPHGRLLIITPAQSGTAVERNRIRRRLKAIFYEHKWYQYPYDVALRISKEAMTLTFDQLHTLLTNIFQRIPPP